MTKTHFYGSEIVNGITQETTATHDVVLFTTVGTASEATPFVELTPGQDGYARVGMTTTNFATLSTDGTQANTAAISFTASANWASPVTGAGIRRISDGKILDFDSFGSPKTVASGETITFDPGDFTISEV